MCTSLLLAGIDLSVLHVAVPSITRQLLPSGSELLWIVDIYSLTVAAFLVTCGTLGDRIGRKRLLLTGFAVFGAASAAGAFSSTTIQLIIARALLGMGTAMIISSTVSTIRVIFVDDRERAIAIGIWTSAHSVGATIGPALGGVLVEHWWWGAVFLINVPIIALVLAGGALVVPESKDPTPRRWDLASAILSIAGLAAVVYSLKQAGEHNGLTPVVLTTGSGGLVLLGIFVLRQRRLSQPLLDMSLFVDSHFSVAIACVLGCFGSYIALLFFLTQSFQFVGGYSPLQAGLALMPLAAANAVGAISAPWLASRWGIQWAMTGALVVFACALAALTVTPQDESYGVLVAIVIPAGACAGVVMTLGADAIMAAAQPERAGEAAAIQETSFELGAGLGVAILGTILAVTYRAMLAPIPGLTPHDYETASRSIGAAIEVAGRIDPTTAQALQSTARGAFEQGFTAAMAMAAAVLTLTAALSVTRLRDRHRQTF
jgi:DHA2 family multidrug resistance protein-like MFS transporter